MHKRNLVFLALALTALVVVGTWGGDNKRASSRPIAIEPVTPPSDRVAEAPALAVGASPGKTPAPASQSLNARLPDINLAANLESLTEQANRDPQLAYELAKALLRCTMADAAYEAMSEEAGNPRVAASAEGTLTEMEKVYGKCDGLNGNHSELQFELAGQAARAGILEAMKEYRGLAAGFVASEAALRRPTAAAEFANNVRTFTDRAAETGDRAALYNAYAFYSDGMLVKPDLVRAHRYLSRFNRSKPSPFAPAALADLEKQMTPQQLEQATKMR